MESFSEFSLNRELADAEDLAVIDYLALDLLAEKPAEIHRRYGLATDNEAGVMFQAVSLEGTEGKAFVNVSLTRGDADNEKLVLIFKPDNELDCLGLGTGDDLQEATAIAQDLIETGQLNPAELAVVRYMQELTFCINGLVSADTLAQSMRAGSGDKRHVADNIRDLIAEKAMFTISIREFEIPFSQGKSLKILEHIAADDLNVESGLGEIMPSLQIDFEDWATDIGYCYTKFQDGRRNLEPYKPSVDTDLSEYTDEEDAVDRLLSDLGADAPQKEDAALLTSVLIEAALAVAEG